MSNIYFKRSELIGLVDLMLRWPVFCFSKIAFAYIGTANREQWMKQLEKPRSWITIYKVYRTFQEESENELTVACIEAERNYASLLKAVPYLYFELREVRAAERAFRDLVETPDGYDARYVCTPKNLNNMVQITLHYLCNGGLLKNLGISDDDLPYDNWNPANYEEIALPPDGLVLLAPHEIKPMLPGENVNIEIRRKHDIRHVQDYVITRCSQGITNPHILCNEIDSLFPGLSDVAMGRLLPVQFFPHAKHKIGKTVKYYDGMYDDLDELTPAAFRKRGQRLRGKV